MRALVLAVLSGCNQLFELAPTRLVDGAVPPPPDAPFACPADATPPQFKRFVTQHIPGNCSHYTESREGDLAVAHCVGAAAEIVEGTIDGPLTAVTLPAPPGAYLVSPRLSPEGDELWVRQENPPSFTIESYRRGAGGWVHDATLPVTLSMYIDSFTPPTARSHGPRRFVHFDPVASIEGELAEYRESGGTWTLNRTYTTVDLGVSKIGSAILLSEDGLRVMFDTSFEPNVPVMGYAWRATIDDTFGTAVAIPSAPLALDPFLSADCGRFYGSNVGGIFYAQQL